MNAISNSVEKAFRILFTFTVDTPEQTLSEIVRKTGLNKTTAYRYLSSLMQLGMIQKDSQNGRYQLGLRLYELGNRVAVKKQVVDIAHPILRKLVDMLDITVHMATIDGYEVLYLDKIKSKKSLQMNTYIGARVPLHCTALGKSMLSVLPPVEVRQLLTRHPLVSLTPNTITDVEQLLVQLSQFRQQGYALDNEEYEEGLRCVGVPIEGADGRPLAAISVSGTPLQINQSTIPQLVKSLRRAAGEISVKMKELGITHEIL